MNNFFKSLFGLAFVALSPTVTANTITIEADDWGWYLQDGSHLTSNPNTWTGNDGGSTFRNSFYNFDVGGIADGSQIISASINFLANNGMYDSTDLFETVEIWDVDTIPGLGSSVQVYNDLMTGVKYGETDVYKGTTSTMPGFSVGLSSQSFADILADDFFSLGAHISSLTEGNRQILWSGSGVISPAATLTIELFDGDPSPVHEPGILLMLGLGFLGIGYARKANLKNIAN